MGHGGRGAGSYRVHEVLIANLKRPRALRLEHRSNDGRNTRLLIDERHLPRRLPSVNNPIESRDTLLSVESER